jgi:ribose 5-phosphate isomerase B
MTINIIIASDHAGYEMKQFICKNSINKEYTIIDLGTHTNLSVDYPDFAISLCNSLKDKNNINPFEITFGVLLCGSGIGMSIAANRYSWIRAALCTDKPFVELSRKHNDANVLVLPARFINNEDALEWIDLFINTDFEGGRHNNRLKKIK